MNRLCIFSFYHPQGYVGKYVEYLLNEIKECANRILFVVNGKIDEAGRHVVLRYTSEIYIRENTGFDVGAYKTAIFQHLHGDLSAYDEVVLCNDTFYGFFNGLKDIFFEMEHRGVYDFWGMSYIKNNFANHIQSYFMVFGKRIIERQLLQQYFSRYVDENLLDIKILYFTFESGFFHFLTEKNQMKFGVYANLGNRNIYSDASSCLRFCRLPIMKRKSACPQHYDENGLLNSLRYIKKETEFDVGIVLEDLKASYDISADEKKLDEDYGPETEKKRVFVSRCNARQIEKFMQDEAFYIMGAGGIATTVYWLYAHDNPNFLGFVISNNQEIKDRTIFRKKVYKLSEIECGSRLVVAMNPVHSSEVLTSLSGYKTLYMA